MSPHNAQTELSHIARPFEEPPSVAVTAPDKPCSVSSRWPTFPDADSGGAATPRAPDSPPKHWLFATGRRLCKQARTDARLVIATRAVDAFLISYPKSGRTWLRFVIANYFQAASDLDLEIDLHTMFQVLPNYDLDPIRGLPGFRFQNKVPLIAVSHRMPARHLFRRLPAVFLIRDPRDVIVSSYFHATRHKRRFHGDIKSFIEDPHQGLITLIHYLNAWAARLPDHRNIVVTYEELSCGTEDTVLKIFEFLGIKPYKETLTEAVSSSNFDRMRALEKRQGIPAHQYNTTDSESLRMRRGSVGGFDAYLSEGDIALIREMCRSHLSSSAKALVSKTPLDIA